MARVFLIAAILITAAFFAHAQDNSKIDRMTADAMKTFTPDTLPWQDEPILPKGAKSALILGDPSKPGVFIAYLKFPPNYQIPAHTHPFAEVITVLNGKLGNGMGEKFDKEKLVFLYQEETKDGSISRFQKFVDRDTARNAS